MERTIADYVREDEVFRQILLKQKGGIMKYWAEHPDSDFDIDLFDGYEEQIVEYYRQANKTNRAICSMSKDELKRKARDWYRLTEKEIGFGVKLYQELSCIYKDVANLVESCIWNYLIDAYKDYRRMCAPNGITPKDFYEEALREFQVGGLAVNCMDFILREHHCPEEWQKIKNVKTLTTEFLIYQYIDAYYRDGCYRKLRQGVWEKLEGKSCDECRREAIKMMKAVKGFSHMLYVKTEPTHVHLMGTNIEYTVDREWLLDVASPIHYIGSHRRETLRSCFSDFVGILEDIGRIWAARLLITHHIDMYDLQEETGCILYPLPNPMIQSDVDSEDIYRYYVDKDYGDPLDDECCIYDEQQAKELLEALKGQGSGEALTLHNDDTITQSETIPSQKEKTPPPHEDKQPHQRGRPKKKFEDFVHEDAPANLMPVLEELMNGASGRKALTIILSIIGVYIDKPTAKSVCERFNTVKENTYGQALALHEGRPSYKKNSSEKPKPIPESELTEMRKKIDKRIAERDKLPSKQPN